MQITNIPHVWWHTYRMVFPTFPCISHSPTTICKSLRSILNSTESTHMCFSLTALQNKCTSAWTSVHALTQRDAIHSFIHRHLSSEKKKDVRRDRTLKMTALSFLSTSLSHSQSPHSDMYLHTEGKRPWWSYTICVYVKESGSRFLFFS